MTKVVVQSAVGESFSFSDSKFKLTHLNKEPTMIIGDSSELDENTILFNDKMTVDSERSSDNTICGSNANDSEATDSQMTVENVMENSEDSNSRAVQKEIISKGFKYVSTKTTVINRTYNVISQSAISGIKSIPTITKPRINPATIINDDTDKSRVVVQILTSDAKKTVKSQTIEETKSANGENQTTHSFRDDVFKILSNPQSTKLKFAMNSQENERHSKKYQEISNKPNGSNAFQTVSSKPRGRPYKSNSSNSTELVPCHAEDSTQMVRKRRKRSLKSYFLFGRGPKISDIEHVSTYLQTATPNALRMVHYVLYDKYGLCSSEQQILQTRKNILSFCGYPFTQKSPEFLKRANCLQKIPLPMLYEVHAAIFGKTDVNDRLPMVQQLMQFFLKPKRYDKVVNKLKQNVKFMSEEEYNTLKGAVLKGPLPRVPLKRLKMDDIEKIKNEIKMKEKSENRVMNVESENIMEKKKSGVEASNYCLPAYILKGPGVKLKHFPTILRNIKRANEKNINLLHYILYGRVESKSVEVSKRNILEFSGFLKCQTVFIAERKATLLRLDQTELLELCEIFCLCAKTNSKIRRIQKILAYLKKPFNPAKIRGNRFRLGLLSSGTSETEVKISVSESIAVKEPPEEFLDDLGKVENDDHSWKLRDFKQICYNIECSAPSDLIELNDLLFMKPCDETEIHEKILNFTRFSFTDNSFHYHYRKTLMFYMGPAIVCKIAKLLDLDDGGKISSHEELSSSILNFLMGKKCPKSTHTKSTIGSSFKNNFNESQESQIQSFHITNESAIVKHQTSKAITCHKGSVFIHRLSKATVEESLCNTSDNQLVPVSMEQRNEIAVPCIQSSEDSVPLRDYIHYPTDEELKQVVYEMIKENLWHITMGDLVQRVYQHYSKFNLAYREIFIKAVARQMICDLRKNAVDFVQQMSNDQPLEITNTQSNAM